MAFWVFMLIVTMALPLVMLLFGRRFMHNPPKEINSFYGYRTAMSSKNMDTWIFAHKHNGRLWFIGGWILLAVSALVMLFVLGRDKDTVGIVGACVCYGEIMVMLGSIVLTERALRKNFYKDGTRK